MQCAPNSTSQHVASVAEEDCVCDAGFERAGLLAEGPLCVPCPRDSFCAGGNTTVCPYTNMVSPPGSDELSDCKCRPGYFPDSPTSCGLCPEDHYCLGGVPPEPCGGNMSTPAGSNHSLACICDAGFYGPQGGPCQLCPANSWCWGGILNQ
eukprot:1109497-Rhodomonas_salina.1